MTTRVLSVTPAAPPNDGMACPSIWWFVPKKASNLIQLLLGGLYAALALSAVYYICLEAYDIRLNAIKEYGPIIHEFDPYFNYRATEYLWAHGYKKFFSWFDYMVWYPLGRPVGTTIYPGMQFTAVALKQYYFADTMSINDICCYIPAWFGALASIFTGLLAHECAIGNPGQVGPSSSRPQRASIVSSTSPTETPASTTEPKTTQTSDDIQEFTCILSSLPLIGLFYNRYIGPAILWIYNQFTYNVLQGATLDIRIVKAHRPFASPALECGIFAAAIMSVVPAHLMRSVAGGFDNESVAISAMTLTFLLWTRSLRADASNGPSNHHSAWIWGIATGIAYFYMVASWGGYVFVINLIGVHAAILVLLGRFSHKLYAAYTAFYFVGTALAIQVPVVGWTPLKSLEQLGALAVFLAFQLIQFSELIRYRRNYNTRQAWAFRIQVFAIAFACVAVVVALLWPTGYFGPISSRIRGLFVKHTKTGNPLVDSVAEHQPASKEAYLQYLSDLCYIAPLGFAFVALFGFHDSSSFLLVYGVAAYFFSLRMMRLVLLTGPIASALSGVFLGKLSGWIFATLWDDFRPGFDSIWYALIDSGSQQHQPHASPSSDTPDENESNDTPPSSSSSSSPSSSLRKKKKKSNTKPPSPKSSSSSSNKNKVSSKATVLWILFKLIRVGISVYIIRQHFIPRAQKFWDYSRDMASRLSHPTILFKANTREGQTILVDDYREAYWWLRDNTPQDARVMAWWDYGYQIAGIGNRTTIADGNTWNHEHIALLGRTLTSPEKEGHRIARHLADYILIWAGGGGDDLAKSPHLRRIANSVYRGLCPNDPTCHVYGFRQGGVPTKMMEESLLYKLHSNGIRPGVEVDKNRFRQVYASRYGKVRIYKVLSVSQESKDWVANPANRLCDAPGSWFCPGQYPPGLRKVLAQKQDFAQLEDFNKGRSDDSEYQKQYFDNLNNPDKAKQRAANTDNKQRKQSASSSSSNQEQKQQQQQPKKISLSQERIDEVNRQWSDSEALTAMWNLVSSNSYDELRAMLLQNPLLAHHRSSDGRGPMWWAHEYRRDKIIKLLKSFAVRDDLRDKDGITPVGMRR